MRHAKGQLILKVFKQTLYVKGDQWMPNEEAEKMIDQDIADETQKRFDSTLSDCETLYGGNLFGTTPSFYFIPIVWQYPGQLIRPMSHYVLAHRGWYFHSKCFSFLFFPPHIFFNFHFVQDTFGYAPIAIPCRRSLNKVFSCFIYGRT